MSHRQSEERRPRVDLIEASYFRKGKCAACGRSAERSLTFTGTSLADCQRQADNWRERPLTHRRCDGMA